MSVFNRIFDSKNSRCISPCQKRRFWVDTIVACYGLGNIVSKMVYYCRYFIHHSPCNNIQYQEKDFLILVYVSSLSRNPIIEYYAPA